MMPNELSNTSKTEIKGLVKEAIKEWLTEQAAQFGWMSLKFICALGIAAVLWLTMIKAGWRPPQ